MILVISNAYDDVATSIIAGLNDRHARWARFNVPAFPLESHVAFDPTSPRDGVIVDESGDLIELSEVRTTWIWKPSRPSRVPGLAPGASEFVQDACERTCQCLSYLLEPSSFMVNEPSRMRLAEDKGVQLRLARRLGLAVPATLITNSPQRARAFCDRFPEVVFKLINCPRIADDDMISWIGTNLLSDSDLAALDHLVASPGIFQERIPKRCDLRVTIVGNQVFPVEIHSQADARTSVDFRRTWLDEVPLVHAVHALPALVLQQCIALARGLGLATCAIDLVLTPEGEYVFLEVNPGGQWGWIEEATQLPITKAMVDLLVRGDL